MDSDFIAYIRKEKKFNLSVWQYIQAYLFSIIAAMFFIYYVIDFFFLNEFDFEKLDKIIIILASVFAPFILLTWQRTKTLKFITFRRYPSGDAFGEAVRTTAKQMNWCFKYYRPDFIIVTFYNRKVSKETQELTIFHDKDGVHINSMTELSMVPFPFSFGNRMKGIRNFIQNLEYETKGINSEEKLQEKIEVIENESEWNYDSIVKRIFAYFFIFLWLFIFVLIIYSGSYYAAIGFSPVIVLSVLYIYFDRKVILEKRGRNKK